MIKPVSVSFERHAMPLLKEYTPVWTSDIKILPCTRFEIPRQDEPLSSYPRAYVNQFHLAGRMPGRQVSLPWDSINGSSSMPPRTTLMRDRL
ncbi:hypothetical protein Bca52824_032327 [Brassica carinata]|uniref:Uncharacterized protein n=1 Tax=Brassica carinata TaxID=52824 RepID=A0A8X7V7G0_BRACI|nr:hypothetical protein Bca52824_032327 [Brassica carinata]